MSARRMLAATRVSVVVGAIHALGYLTFAVVWALSALGEPTYAKVYLLLAAAALVMASCLGVTLWGILRRKRVARAPLLTLFLVEFFSFLVSIGDVPAVVSVIGLTAVIGGWGLLTGTTREYLGVEERPSAFD